ncbi:MAG: peptidoglycan DD-metalloendopeptidase family protein [Firmicutes bacterium]|nr:peptidoglycan DD-metalloendopeptidase family protein [Bacillota bacterium]
MKKFIFITAFILFGCVSVSAATSDDILEKYSIKPKTVDVEALKEKLSQSYKDYGELSDKYYKITYLNNAEELTNVKREREASKIDTEKCMLELKRLSDCLDAMVNVDATLEELEDVEDQYREKVKELNELMTLKEMLNSKVPHFSENTGNVSYDEVDGALKETERLKAEIGNAVIKEDIGELNGLKSPTQGLFNITSKFGNRTDPITGSGIERHSGLDLAAPKDTPVLALFKGNVIAADYNSSLGNYVIIAHSSEFQTLYAHMNSLNVKKNDTVNQYDTIGFVGTTGSSTGHHLHLGVYINGVKSDPEVLFK